MKQCDSCQSKVIFKIETPTLLNKVSVTLLDVIFGSVWIYFWYRITSFSTDFILTLQEGESSWLSTFAIKHVCQSNAFSYPLPKFPLELHLLQFHSCCRRIGLTKWNAYPFYACEHEFRIEQMRPHPKSWSCFFPKIPTFCHRIDQT